MKVKESTSADFLSKCYPDCNYCRCTYSNGIHIFKSGINNESSALIHEYAMCLKTMNSKRESGRCANSRLS